MNTTTVAVKTRSEANLRGSWHAKAGRAAKAREAVRAGCTALTRPRLPCVVRLTRIAPGTLDTDNLAGALKGCRDGVADWLGIDDGRADVHYLYAQQKAKRGIYGVIIEIIPRAVVVVEVRSVA